MLTKSTPEKVKLSVTAVRGKGSNSNRTIYGYDYDTTNLSLSLSLSLSLPFLLRKKKSRRRAIKSDRRTTAKESKRERAKEVQHRTTADAAWSVAWSDSRAGKLKLRKVNCQMRERRERERETTEAISLWWSRLGSSKGRNRMTVKFSTTVQQQFSDWEWCACQRELSTSLPKDSH